MKKVSPGFQTGKTILSRGFTLLEVMVALTITGMALGGLFGVIAGNKRLAWSSEQSLERTMQVRSMINFSQLNDELGDVYINFGFDDIILDAGYEIEPPERKTQASPMALRQYELIDEFGEVIHVGTYWVELELAE
jgi:prepilin-type N-terminal cleavage/methylation domain-containing protein